MSVRMREDIEALKEAMGIGSTTLADRVTALETALEALEARVEALENAEETTEEPAGE